MDRFHSCAVVSETEVRLSAWQGIHKPVVTVYIRKELNVSLDLIRYTEFEEYGYLVFDGNRISIVKITLAVKAVSRSVIQIKSPYAVVSLMLYVGMERGTAHDGDAVFGSGFQVEAEVIRYRINEVESQRNLDHVYILLIPERMDEGEMIISLPIRIDDAFPLCRSREGGRGTIVREISAYS